MEITQQAYEQGVDALNDLVIEAMREAHAKSVEVGLGAGGAGGVGERQAGAEGRQPGGEPGPPGCTTQPCRRARCVLRMWPPCAPAAGHEGSDGDAGLQPRPATAAGQHVKREASPAPAPSPQRLHTPSPASRRDSCVTCDTLLLSQLEREREGEREGAKGHGGGDDAEQGCSAGKQASPERMDFVPGVGLHARSRGGCAASSLPPPRLRTCLPRLRGPWAGAGPRAPCAPPAARARGGRR